MPPVSIFWHSQHKKAHRMASGHPVPISSATPGTHDAQDSKEETRVLQLYPTGPKDSKPRIKDPFQGIQISGLESKEYTHIK